MIKAFRCLCRYRLRVTEVDSHMLSEHQQSDLLVAQLDDFTKENSEIDKEIQSNEEEMVKLQKRVDEKKRFVGVELDSCE